MRYLIRLVSSCIGIISVRRLFIRLHNYGVAVAQILWGIWLIPFGILIMRSEFILRWLSYPLSTFNSVGTLFLPSIRPASSYEQTLGLGECPILIMRASALAGSVS